MVMNRMIEVKAEGLERQAALREQHAEDAETRALGYGGRSPLYFQALDKAEAYRAEARQWRDEAAQLRRNAR